MYTSVTLCTYKPIKLLHVHTIHNLNILTGHILCLHSDHTFTRAYRSYFYTYIPVTHYILNTLYTYIPTTLHAYIRVSLYTYIPTTLYT